MDTAPPPPFPLTQEKEGPTKLIIKNHLSKPGAYYQNLTGPELIYTYLPTCTEI